MTVLSASAFCSFPWPLRLFFRGMRDIPLPSWLLFDSDSALFCKRSDSACFRFPSGKNSLFSKLPHTRENRSSPRCSGQRISHTRRTEWARQLRDVLPAAPPASCVHGSIPDFSACHLHGWPLRCKPDSTFAKLLSPCRAYRKHGRCRSNRFFLLFQRRSAACIPDSPAAFAQCGSPGSIRRSGHPEILPRILCRPFPGRRCFLFSLRSSGSSSRQGHRHIRRCNIYIFVSFHHTGFSLDNSHGSPYFPSCAFS